MHTVYRERVLIEDQVTNTVTINAFSSLDVCSFSFCLCKSLLFLFHIWCSKLFFSFSFISCFSHAPSAIIYLSLSFSLSAPPPHIDPPHPSEDRSRLLDAGCVFTAVPWPGRGTCRAAEGPGGPACHQASPRPKGHTRPQLGGQQLQAAAGPSAAEECGGQEVGSSRTCCWTRPDPFRT